MSRRGRDMRGMLPVLLFVWSLLGMGNGVSVMYLGESEEQVL